MVLAITNGIIPFLIWSLVDSPGHIKGESGTNEEGQYFSLSGPAKRFRDG